MPNDFPELKGINDFLELESDDPLCVGEPPKEVVAEDTFTTLGAAAQSTIETAHAAHRISPLCESPIEVDLGAQLLRFLPEDYELVAQYRFYRFRYDFAIKRSGILQPLAFIECDGAAWHSTPEQIANDKKKDEAATAGGIVMFRFTGSEIVRDARRCAEQIIRALS